VPHPPTAIPLFLTFLLTSWGYNFSFWTPWSFLVHGHSLFHDFLARCAQIDPLPSCSPTPFHISLPTLPHSAPSISPLFYTYIHPPPTFFPIPIPPFILYASPAPYPTISLFVPFIAIPLLQASYPMLPLYIPLLSYAPQPISGPPHPPYHFLAPYPSFRFLTDLWALSCMYFHSIPYIYVHI
jgi:hypothetical protein